MYQCVYYKLLLLLNNCMYMRYIISFHEYILFPLKYLLQFMFPITLG